MRGAGSLGRLGSLLVLTALAAPVHGADSADLKFFEDKIRPVFVKHCYECHSAQAKKVRGGLLLDTKGGLLKGGDSGPALVPGKAVESLLVRALQHDEIAMPPKEKLPDAVIADFEKWVRMGAPDPREAKQSGERQRPESIDLEKGRQFWAFQLPRRHAPPSVRDTNWPRTDIDRFFLAAQEAKGIKPVRDADRITLLRRATIALIGLPPTPEEVDAFVHDTALDADAFAKVVNRLLASAHFGERWGRHWLDVARYADSNGRDENLTFHEAYLYRDYVIRSFNADKPIDRFIREQIAGDLLPADDAAQQQEALIGSGFLVIGPKVLADRDQAKRKMDVIDEQIDTVGRAFLGLTLGCARCHDHKFDPIPTADYYALAGIFSSTRTLDGIKLGNPVVSGWMLRPLSGDDETKHIAFQEHKKKLDAVDKEIKKLKADLKLVEDKAAMRTPSKLIGITVDDKQAKLVGQWKPSTYNKPYVGDGYQTDDKSGKGEKSAVFTPKLPKAGEYEVLIAYTIGTNRATNVPIAIRHANGEAAVTVNQQKPPKIDGLFHSLGKYTFEAGEQGSVTISNRGTDNFYVIIDAVRFVPAGALEKDPEMMGMGVAEEVKKQIADTQTKLKQLEAEDAKLKKSPPPAPRLVMATRDIETPINERINVRGNPHQLGAEVPRGFVQVASLGPTPAMPANQSGRAELAEWIASPKNPLTARVFVNRVWHHLFGAGLVRTVDNFGVQGERPSHPELLDELALRFMDNGWSVKRLIRSIMLSRVYALACNSDEGAAKADPENRLHWRANRRRVEAEVIRDSMLAVAGRLDRTPGGCGVAKLGERAVDNDSKGGVATDSNLQRSVYLPILRNELPQLFEVFDFADPDVSTGKRDATTVPTQALYLMNSPFVVEQAKAAAKRLLAMSADDGARLTDLYHRALGRAPTTDETRTVLDYLGESKKTANASDERAWTSVCQALFGCTEFRFVE